MTRILILPMEVWVKVHAYCRHHDVDAYRRRVWDGEDVDLDTICYDAPTGGAINVWTLRHYVERDGTLHGTYYPTRADGRHPGELLEEAMKAKDLTAMRRLLSVPGFVAGSGLVEVYWQTGLFKPAGVYDPRRNWSPEMAREHLMQLVRMVMDQEDW